MTDLEVLKDALKRLSPIKANRFIKDHFTSGNLKKTCCVIGHYTRLTSENPEDYSTYNCCDNCISPLRRITNDEIVDINNNSSNTNRKSNVINYLRKKIKELEITQPSI